MQCLHTCITFLAGQNWLSQTSTSHNLLIEMGCQSTLVTLFKQVNQVILKCVPGIYVSMGKLNNTSLGLIQLCSSVFIRGEGLHLFLYDNTITLTFSLFLFLEILDLVLHKDLFLLYSHPSCIVAFHSEGQG